ncbi:MAG: hypothetical protein ACRDFW_07415 [bacterium]
MPEHLLCGDIKGVRRIYLQSVVDAFTSVVLATLGLSKLPMTRVGLPHERVLQFYPPRGMAIEHLPTYNARRFCRWPLERPDRLFLGISQIAHRHANLHPPYTNGFHEPGSRPSPRTWQWNRRS